MLRAELMSPRRVASGLLRRIDRLWSDHTIHHWSFAFARFVLERRRPLIIGITGSVGKTTTTRAIAAVLQHPGAARVVGAVRATPNNMNNYVGLPLVVLGYRAFLKSRAARMMFIVGAPLRTVLSAFVGRYPDVLVLEYGTDRAGYLAPLVDLARPHVSVVTAIGPAHLAGLGTLENVAREKSTLLRGTRPGGFAVIGEGHDFVQRLEEASAVPVVKVAGRGAELSRNVAREIGKRLAIPHAAVEEALAALPPAEGRLRKVSVGGMTVIDDSYNANPLSMRLGLDTLGQERQDGRRLVAVLGTMKELGTESVRFHQEIGRYARTIADLVIGVGELTDHYAPDHRFADAGACAAAIAGLVRAPDCVLVKGSASVELGRVVRQLEGTQ